MEFPFGQGVNFLSKRDDLKIISEMPASALSRVFLGIESGATRTVTLSGDGRLMQRKEFGPANIRLLSDEQLRSHFARIKSGHSRRPIGIGIGMAGARSETDLKRIRAAAAVTWPGIPVVATNDLETALAASSIKDESARPRLEPSVHYAARVLILSGTGSCCFARADDGRTAKVGGWGHLLGDKGSGYQIGLRAVKASLYFLDVNGVWPRLGVKILSRLALNEPNDLIPWAQTATKADVAALATVVFNEARRDKVARDIVSAAVSSLVKDASACARRLASRNARIEFVLAGSVLLKQPTFARRVGQGIRKEWPRCLVTALPRESVWGAWSLAQQVWNGDLSSATLSTRPLQAAVPENYAASSPTEQRHPRSMHLDRMSIPAAIELMLSEDETIPRAIRKERKKIAQAVGWIASAFRKGGRLFYAGAGTSGRLGILDASECPPTFRTPPEMVQGIIAGGRDAIWRAVEGAEDDMEAGQLAIAHRAVRKRDVVVGIAASGRTPFVRGVLLEARRRGATTILLCFNPHVILSPRETPSLVICPPIGPELVTGSTRLKAGTATKLILNMFSTLAMVRIGKVVSNLMIDLHPSNVKLRARAVRILSSLTQATSVEAEEALEKSGWIIKNALHRLKLRD